MKIELTTPELVHIVRDLVTDLEMDTGCDFKGDPKKAIEEWKGMRGGFVAEGVASKHAGQTEMERWHRDCENAVSMLERFTPLLA